MEAYAIYIIAIFIAAVILIILVSKFLGISGLKIEDVLTEDEQSAIDGLGEPKSTFCGKNGNKVFVFNAYENFIVVLCNGKALKINRNNPDIRKKLYIKTNEGTVIVSNFEGELPPDSEPFGIKVTLKQEDIRKLKQFLDV